MILNSFATRHRARELTTVRERLTHLVDGTPEQKLAAFVAIAEERGLSRGNLVARTAWRDEVVQNAIDAARGTGSVAEIGGQLLSPGVSNNLSAPWLKTSLRIITLNLYRGASRLKSCAGVTLRTYPRSCFVPC